VGKNSGKEQWKGERGKGKGERGSVLSFIEDRHDHQEAGYSEYQGYDRDKKRA
jgi:hypothetical protein